MIWFVIFHPKEKRHWWARRFAHVSLAGYENNTWTQLDLGRAGVDVRTFYAHDEVQDYLSYLTAHHTVLRYDGLPARGRGFGWPMTCVGFVKHVLGLSGRALLPDHLFAMLVKDSNSVMINDPQKTGRDRRTEGGAPPV